MHPPRIQATPYRIQKDAAKLYFRVTVEKLQQAHGVEKQMIFRKIAALSAAKALTLYLKRFGGGGMTLRRDTRKAPANEGGFVLRGAGDLGIELMHKNA